MDTPYESRIMWEKMSPFQGISMTYWNVFQVPHSKDWPYHDKKDLHLRDTLVLYGGEGWAYAGLVYKENPASYRLPHITLKVTRISSSGLKEEKYITIVLSYGC